MGRCVNYRKLYAEHFNIKIPNHYDIHHIDRDRENNQIDNLLLLPKDLHSRYHKIFPPIVDHYVISAEIPLYSDLPLEEAEEAVNVMKEISNWVRFKLTNYFGVSL